MSRHRQGMPRSRAPQGPDPYAFAPASPEPLANVLARYDAVADLDPGLRAALIHYAKDEDARYRDGRTTWHRSSLYTASLDREPDLARPEGWPELWWLSFKRNDRKPIGDWRVKQRIKNAIAGPEREGVELYPAESRLVDGANQYHMVILAEEGLRFPFGFPDRHVSDGIGIGERQRPIEE